MKIRVIAAFMLLLLLAPAAWAHPGHGHTEPDTWRHYLTEPVHVLAGAAVMLVAFVVTRAWMARRKAQKMLSRSSCVP